MSFELSRRKHIQDQLVKIARRELRETGRALSASEKTPDQDVIHESRKSVKKVRAVMSLLDQAGGTLPRRDRKQIKAAARSLSRVRDSAAIIETLDGLRRRYPEQLPEHTYGVLRRGLDNARDRLQARAARDGVITDAAERLARTRKAAKAWTLPSIGASDMADVVAASYRRSRKAMKRARATGRSATLHTWRKELKTLWYQMRLSKPLASGVAPLIADLKRLETELGEHHNLVILGATLRACRDLRSMRPALRQIERMAARMRRSLRLRALTLGRRIHSRKPKAFARWVRAAMDRKRGQSAAA